MHSLKRSLFALSLGSCACLVACLVACSFDGGNTGANNDAGNEEIDASDADFDADINIDAGESNPLHLLLSEVQYQPTGSEFIEIYNPSDSDISLDNYYLADNGAYLNLPATSPSIPAYGSDFVTRFPKGNVILGQGIIVVGIGIAPNSPIRPDYQIDPPNGGRGQTMLEAYPGSIRSGPTITDEGEGVILFHWDGVSNLVSDIDIVIAGDRTSEINMPPRKTGISVTGPTGTETYANDAATLPQMPDELINLESYQRVRLEGVHETHDGIGNGITGDDETSEDTTRTWIIADMTPGTVEITD